MPDGLHAAQELAERIRFSGDSLRRSSEGNSSQTEVLKSFFAQTGLRISHEVTPALAQRLQLVCDRLAIPQDTVEAFVYASAELQAVCFAGSTSACVIQLSSALIDLLDEEEFDFVVGHELGHFLLGHGVAKQEREHQSLEYFIQQRSQEISVDRIGLLACGSLDVALRALMKTISGLTSKHLRFDVGTFISQLRRSSEFSTHGHPAASHPSIVVRCRALLWFSLNNLFLKGVHAFSAEQMAKLDERIQNDLNRYVDGPARQLIEEAKANVALWMAAHAFVQDGIFAKHEQESFARTFGEDNLEKLKNFLRDAPATEARDRVKQNLQSSLAELAALIPTSCEAEVERIRQQTQLLAQ